MGLVVVLCIFLSAFSSVFGETTNFSGAGEAVVCRSYFSAKNELTVDRCKNLWRHANILPTATESIDCRVCKRHLQNKNYAAFSSLLERQQNVTLFIDEMKDLHSELGDPLLLCSLFGQCSRDSLVLRSFKFHLNSTCDDCKKIIDDVHILIQNNDTKNAISGYLKRAICFELPLQVVDICKQTIDSYLGFLIDLTVRKSNSGAICALFGLCSDNNLPIKFQSEAQAGSYSWIKRPAPTGFEFFHSRLNSPKQSEDPKACTECKNVFSRIRDETRNPDFDRALKNAVNEKLCESFGYFKSICEAAVSNEVESMIDHASETNITDLCFFFNQCSQNVSPRARALKRSFLYRLAAQQPKQDVGIPFVCPFCEVIFEKVFDLILNNRSEAAIAWALDEVCFILPNEWRNKCIDFITDYFSVIIDEIVKGTTPKLLCMSFGVCDTPSLESAPLFDSGCSLCKVIVDAIYSKIEVNATKDEIVKELDHVCSHLPYAKSECKKLVDKYASQLIDMLVHRVPPDLICQKLGFCNPAPHVPKIGDSCVICEDIIAEVYLQLRDNVTIERIQHVLETICNYVPSSYYDKCHSIIQQNIAIIIDLIEQRYPPRKVCEELSICYYSFSPKTGKCEVCKEIIDYIYTNLEDNATIDQVEKVLETVCDYLPGENLKITCHEYVKAYTQDLVDLLVRKVPSVKVCQELSLCPSRSPIQRLCSGDPSTWCRDNFTAKLCSREDFCREFIWERSSSDASKPRQPIVRRYDCSKLTTTEERCFDKRLMRLCGYEAFCINFRRPTVERSESCRLCRDLIARRLTYGSSALDCSIFVDPQKRNICERICKLKITGRTTFDNLESVCKTNQLCEPTRNSVPPPEGSGRVPELTLVDCDRPLNEICISPDLRYCGPSVLEKCRAFLASQTVGDDVRRVLCKDRPPSFCSDPKMVELCRMGEYCEAMGMNPTPDTSRCRLGNAFACQSYNNAVLCDKVELCRGIWQLYRRSELEKSVV